MTPARFQTIETIFRAALDQEPDQIGAFLDKACEGDDVLRRKVEALLASRQRAGSFIETSAVGLATRIIQNGQADSLVDQTIGHYKISESIGAGGMGEVYLATDITAGRKAALKLLPMRFTGDAERLKRFQREAHAVVALNHPNILTVYEIGEDHSTHYIASELIEGETLRQRLMHERMQLSEAVDVAIQVANALVAAHETGIVHRDIKPENIMLRPDGYVKVLDFGIAKLAEQELPATMPRDEALLLVETNLGSILGTVRYMSPEQACGAPVDKTTDIWSLGVVLYEMVTRHAPFAGDTPKQVMSSILEKEPPPLTLYIARAPAELQQIIGKTLRKDREQRYQSARELLQALKDLRRKLEADLERAAAPLWLRWARSPAALVFVLTIAALALALPFYRHRNLATSLPPDKSIAVLPFENLSDEKEHAAFADGIQDDILTKLAKIADLKVISRTSVMDYRGKRNLRQIGNDLRVSHVLEGSVRRAGTHLRLNAQLIDTRTDTHVWARQYDRDLDDLFAIQSEIAQEVAERLNAKVTSAERLAIEEKPTTDLMAFELYSRAIDVLAINAQMADNLKAIDLLNQAVTRDPSFLKAYCLLALAHDVLYSFNWDHTPARLALAEAAIREAFRIRPNAGEAHWARACHLYNGYRDYDGALAELEIARRSLPNDSWIFRLMGSIQRRQGRWEESTRNFERAIELDPRDLRLLFQTAGSYGMFRRYAEQKSKLDRALTVAPNDAGLKADRAFVEVDWKADTAPLHQVIDEIRATNPAAVPKIAWRWLVCALAERDLASAKDALVASGEFPLETENVHFPRPFVEGVIARMTNDEHKAQLAFAAARAKQEKTAKAQPDYAPGWCVLGVIDAALGRKEEALREGRRAVELLPVEKDSINGLVMIKYLAMIAAWVGETDLACEQLATAVRYPSGLELSYGELKLMPWWDALRGDLRFEKIVEESKQPIALELVEKNAPEKSIAVLPFENLSKDEENAFFAGGVQDEILTDLAKIADLKVISRTSVMQYKSGPERNLREIAKTLGVSHVVEGSVQRAGERVRVSAQLIDARNDTHLWAEHYDRDFADIFAVQNEIAQQIAEQLKANLSPAEKAAIAERPTADPVAYALYTEAKTIGDQSDWEGAEKKLNREVELLEKATQRDPNFALAYCTLAQTQVDLSAAIEGPEDRKHLELAKKAAEAASRVRPDLGEAHLELARYYYYANLHTSNFDQARDELAIARRTLPNNSDAIMIGARIDKRQNRWDASLANFQKASELDPRNGEVRWRLGQTYFQMRRYKEWEQLLMKDAGSGLPGDPWTQLLLAEIRLAQGDPVAAQSLLEQVPLDFSPSEQIWGTRFMAALYLRDYDAANRVIAATPAKFVDRALGGQPPEIGADGQVALLRGDKEKALAVFAGARKKLDATWSDKPKDEEYFRRAGMLDARLGRKEDAIREARQAVDLMPIAKDSQWGPIQVADLALVYAWTGERDRALEQLEIVATIPGEAPTTYGDLRFNPCWDDLRGDKRFDKIVAAAKAASR